MPRPDHLPPPRWRVLTEAMSVGARMWRAMGKLGPHGAEDAEPALVIPGFLATDRTTLGLQRALAEAGFRVTGWGLGMNKGAREDTLERIVDTMERFGGGRPVLLVGWSLGGVYAREAAKLRPDLVSAVVTMGSPFSVGPRANNAWRTYELVSGHKVDALPIQVDVAVKPPVPTLACWSRRDGVVAPASARGEEGERDAHLEFDCTHMAFATSGRVYPKLIRAIRDWRETAQRPPEEHGSDGQARDR